MLRDIQNNAYASLIQTTKNPWHADNAGWQVYVNNTRLTLQDCLRRIYTTIQVLVGDDSFKSIIQHYVRKTLPKTPDLTFYGEDFPEFLASISDLKPWPYLHDMAMLDWLLYTAGFAKTLEPLPLKCDNWLKIMPFIHVQPCISILESQYNLPALYAACQNNTDADFNINSPSYIMINGDDGSIKTLDAIRFLFIKTLRQTNSFETATQTVSKHGDIQSLLTWCLESQILTKDTIL